MNQLTHGDPVALATWGLVVTTFLLFIGTILLAYRTRKAAEAVRIAERAYIKISHAGPLRFASNGVGVVPVSVENRGHTPAHVTDVRVNHMIAEALPEKPDYGPANPLAGNDRLVGRMRFSFTRPIIISPGELDAINQKMRCLYLIGYADYTDAFGRKNRVGFVRRFEPNAPEGENNLSFVDHSAEYEYDSRIKRWAL